MKHGLYIISTPIGNLNDISYRALETLKNVDIIACEDTRTSSKLLNNFSIKKKLISLHDHNEEEKADYIIKEIQSEKSIALISDAGSPLISDPGYKLVKKCKENDVYITTIPGACAIICGLQLSGLPTNNFFFAGFIPNKEKSRFDFINKYKNLDSTLVFYETSRRIEKTLKVFDDIYQENRTISISREITKLYEETLDGTAKELLEKIQKREGIKGELVITVSPILKKEEIKIEDLKNEILQSLKTHKVKDLSNLLSEKYSLPKKDIYNYILKIKND